MLNWKNKRSLSMGYKNITLDEFQEAYNKMSMSEDLVPVASSMDALKDANGGSLRKAESNEVLYNFVIFYEKDENAGKQIDPKTGNVEQKPQAQLFR